MKVLKFGGTSVGTPESIAKLIKIITQENYPAVMVSSAVGGVTNTLQQAIENARLQKENYHEQLQLIEQLHMDIIQAHIPIEKQSKSISFLKSQLNSLEELLGAVFLIQESSDKTIATILSFGELIAVQLLEDILTHHQIPVQLLDSDALVVTYTKIGKNYVDFDITEKNIKAQIKDETKLYLVPGFISKDRNGEQTTLGRGGSDYTAALIAYSLNSEALEIWTDVSGMYTAHPKLVQQAKPIPQLSYHEAMELSHFGAKVIFPPTLQPLVEKNIPLYIKNTFDPKAPGTLINGSKDRLESTIVQGISHIDEVSLLTLEGSGMIGIPGFSKRLFEALSAEKINVIMITQASSEHSICLGIRTEEASHAKEVIDEAFQFEINVHKVSPARVENDMVNIAVVGEGMRNHQGISGKLFSNLGANNINIRAIAQGASERNISIIIDAHNVKKALNTLHESFFEAQVKELNLFITGVGNVGG
ncbi:MAG: aspartate kinase, partial [Flavobacteriaceae bacterium]